jgi:hypothetical protein
MFCETGVAGSDLFDIRMTQVGEATIAYPHIRFRCPTDE